MESTSTLDKSTTDKISAGAGLEVEYGPAKMEASVEAAYESGFSSTVATNNKAYHEEVDDVNVNLSDPTFIYQRQVVIEYSNGNRETLKGARYIANVPQPFRKVITYKGGEPVSAIATPY